MEEGTEFVKRFTQNGPLPLITSCCPAWVDYMEKYYADMIPHFSTAKSPQQMMGAMIKTYWADKAKVDPAKIFSVSIMPCTAKKYENGRTDDMFSSGQKDVDITLTTRELARMIKQAGIDLLNLPDEEPDSPMGPYTGAGTIFGATGGVMEAALRSAYYLITKEDLKDVNFTCVRGLTGVKEARIHIKGTEVRIAVAHQMGNISAVLEEVRKAKAEGKETPWHFSRGVWLAAAGCIAAAASPRCTDDVRTKRLGLNAMTKERISLLAPQPVHRAGVPGVPGKARFAQGPQAPAHALHAETGV
jgi:NADH-quinone oxidoreductase subunit G